jgi:hypothetical protein
MGKQETCKDCIHENDCRAVYRKLISLSAAADSVVCKVGLAFLLPIIVFIISLAAFQQTLAEMIPTKRLLTILSFLLALSVTFVCVLIIRTICHSCETRPRLQSGNRNPEK